MQSMPVVCKCSVNVEYVNHCFVFAYFARDSKMRDTKSMQELQVIYRKTSELIPYANNARKHSDEQVLKIASSIKEFGFTNPILLDGQNGVIAGHGRLMAAKKLGIEDVPTIDLHGMSEAKKKAYIIADNKIAIDADWDFELLNVEFEALREIDFDVSLTGFSLAETGKVMAEMVDDRSALSEHGKNEVEDFLDFKNEKSTSKYCIKVHIDTLQDLKTFSEKMGQNISEKTKFIHYPFKDFEEREDGRVIEVAEGD